MAQRTLLIAVLLVALGCQTGSRPDPARPPEIERTFPNPGDQILAQGEVGADIPNGWSLALQIDGVAIPDDQLEKVAQLGEYRFKPRPGRVIERLRSGEHRATVEVRPPDGRPPITYTWSFRVTA